MAQEITWRNIGATVSPGSASSMSAGTTGVQQALGALGDIISRQQEMNVNNARLQREANTQSYLDQVAASTLEQLSNADYRSGLEAQRDAMGMNLDRAATRDAITKQIAAQQNQAAATQKFDDMQAEVGQRGVVDQLRTLAAEGRTGEVNQILAEQQLINEGEIRKELSGVQDAIANRQYRAAGEQRAQAAANRAAEAHALSMTAGRENLAFTREQRDELRRDRDEAKLVSGTIATTFQDYDESRQAQNEMMRIVGRETGMPTDESGMPDLSRASQDQLDTFRDALERSGVQPNTSATERRNAALQSLVDAGVSSKGIAQAKQEMELRESLEGMAPQDRAKVEATIGAANGELDTLQRTLTEDYEREAARNPFVEPDKDPLGGVNKIMEKAVKSGFGWEGDRQDLNNMLVDFATNGIKLPDGRTAVVPTKLMEQAFNTTNTWLFKNAGDVEKRLIELMTTDGMTEMREDAPTIRENFLKKVSEINNQKRSNAVKVTRSAEREKGVTIDPNDELNFVLRGRKR